MTLTRFAALAALLSLPMQAAAHEGHGWDGLSHAWLHAAPVLDPLLALAAVGLLALSFRSGLLERDHSGSVGRRSVLTGLAGAGLGLVLIASQMLG